MEVIHIPISILLQIDPDMEMNSSSGSAGQTQIKMLIGNEKSKETESKRKSLSVVAQLMGIDDPALAQQRVPVSTKRNMQMDYPSTTLAGVLKGCHQQEVILKRQQCDYDKMKVLDAYKVSQKPSRASNIKDLWGNCNENQNENKMAFVRKIFMEAKHLTKDEKLLHSKEFQDALEILSSNRDLFLKILQDPDSLFLKNIRNVHMSPPLKKKHITVLKPSQKVEKKDENRVMEEKYPLVNKSERGATKEICDKQHWSSSFTQTNADIFSLPNRIVVLKPSTRKPREKKSKVTPPTTLCKLLEQSGFFGELGDSETFGSTFTTKNCTQQGLESITGNWTDKSFCTPVSVNGCRDESLLSKPENVNTEEDGGSFSDSEILTSTSQYSWEYTNRTGSSCSALTFSQDPNSLKSSVVMEAKKQLLEIWASIASNENNREQTRLPRCSFSLGEMLAIKVVKEGENGDKFTVPNSKSCGQEAEPELSTSSKTNGKIKNVQRKSSLINLSRSKSVPISSSVYDHIELSKESSNFGKNKSTETKEIAKSKNEKSTFKEKFSNFLSSKIKKTSRENPVSPPLMGSDDKAQCGSAGFAVNKNVESINPLYKIFPMASSLAKYEERSGNAAYPTPVTVVTKKVTLPRPSTIKSVVRSLSWENAYQDRPSPDLSKCNGASSKVDNYEQEHFVSTQEVLSSGLQKPTMISAGCQPLDSQLDSVPLAKFLTWEKEEAEYREKRTKQHFLFGSVNSAVEIGSTGLTTSQNAYPWNRGFSRDLGNVFANSAVSVEVWDLVRDSFSVKTMWATGEGGIDSLVFDRALMRVKGGQRLAESMRLEVQEIAKEISRDVLKDLVGEALADINA
ncbi:hypothetical protein GW17_00022069 [Ensete ventricosum]|nr:hypothetical protein GW17_00022069 [Ensete ventricosum]RZS02247.1 hypothetical protein BHM03_00032253 [Ensete ventricosum]